MDNRYENKFFLFIGSRQIIFSALNKKMKFYLIKKLQLMTQRPMKISKYYKIF